MQKSPKLCFPLLRCPLPPCSLNDKYLTGHGITPHVATQTDPEYWTKPIAEAIRCIRADIPLKNVVNCQQGY